MGAGDAGEFTHAPNQGPLHRVLVNVPDEIHIQLQIIWVNIRNQVQAGVARAGIVNGNFIVLLAIACNDFFEITDILHRVFFRYFKNHALRVHLIALKIFLGKALLKLCVGDDTRVDVQKNFGLEMEPVQGSQGLSAAQQLQLPQPAVPAGGCKHPLGVLQLAALGTSAQRLITQHRTVPQGDDGLEHRSYVSRIDNPLQKLPLVFAVALTVAVHHGGPSILIGTSPLKHISGKMPISLP
ncbi:hypothetical protein SDC9_65849 [bioreactor metagenome]|uniref:Uncharacterized protein n=1 Tax=bioreactor metagenome TaxID=1076179 RepID=A0A644XTE0_9ZZZZ